MVHNSFNNLFRAIRIIDNEIISFLKLFTGNFSTKLTVAILYVLLFQIF